MNIIKKAISDLKFDIPIDILEEAFMPYSKYGQLRNREMITLDEMILNNVIRPRVLVDCNIVGGQHDMISLAGLPIDTTQPGSSIIRIPKSRTQGKTIITPLSINLVPLMSNNGVNVLGGINAVYNSNPVTTAAAGLYASYNNVPVISSARLQLIGENVLLIKEQVMLSTDMYLRCMLTNDEDLNNIPIRMHLNFSKLVNYATKAYIYNKLIVSLDQGQLQGGAVIGVFKSIIESYADSNQNYQDFLSNRWTKAAFLADNTNKERFLKLLIGGNK